MAFHLPVSPSSRVVRGLSVASLVSEILIVVTGGAVRVTGSGLGCPTWPLCTDDSLVNTPEMGIHGVIEFVNRTLTGPLLIIAIAMVVSLWAMRKNRRDLWGISLALVVGIVLQAVIGGVSVWVNLGPYVVGLHFLVSAILVALATVLVVRVRDSDLPGPRRVSFSSWVFGIATLSVLVAGVLTTGAGPHSGDDIASRNGLMFGDIVQVHRATAIVALIINAVFIVRSRTIAQRKAWTAVAGSYVAQIVVGVLQVQLGLPAEMVIVHLLLSMIIVAVTVRAIYVSTTSGSIATATKRPVK